MDSIRKKSHSTRHITYLASHLVGDTPRVAIRESNEKSVLGTPERSKTFQNCLENHCIWRGSVYQINTNCVKLHQIAMCKVQLTCAPVAVEAGASKVWFWVASCKRHWFFGHSSFLGEKTAGCQVGETKPGCFSATSVFVSSQEVLWRNESQIPHTTHAFSFRGKQNSLHASTRPKSPMQPPSRAPLDHDLMRNGPLFG